MKNQTKRNLAIGTGVVLIANAALALTGCPEPETKYIEVEVPDPTLIFREAEINITYGNKGKLRVEGTLTQSEWDGVPAKVKTALDAAYAKSTNKDAFEIAFSRIGFTIIVTKGLLSGKTYNAQNIGTLYISLDKLNSGDISDKIVEAVEKLSTGAIPYSAQIKNQNRIRFGGGMSPFELV